MSASAYDEQPSEAEIAWLYGSQNGSQPPTEDSWRPLNLAELPDEPPVRPTLGGVGIVYPGKRHVFSGPQESAKTLAAYAIALQVVREGRRVVLIDFEMGPWDCKTRLRELGATVPELAEIAYVEPAEKAEPEDITRLVSLEPALVVIDAAAGAYQLQELDDNKRGDVERFAALYVQGFWRSGIATILLDHVVKNVEARGRYAIGSERKVGGADVHLGFEVVTPIKRGGQGLYKVTTHKDRGGFLRRGKLAEFELASDPDTHVITWAFKEAVEGDEEHPFRPTHLMEKVSRWLELQTSPVSQNAVEEAKLGKRDYVRQALAILVADGFVDERSGARGARLFESLEAYREASDDTHSDLAPTSPRPRPEGGAVGVPDFAPSPMGGEVGGDLAPEGDPTSPQTLDDEVPF